MFAALLSAIGLSAIGHLANTINVWLFTRALNPGQKVTAKIDTAVGAPIVEDVLQTGANAVVAAENKEVQQLSLSQTSAVPDKS